MTGRPKHTAEEIERGRRLGAQIRRARTESCPDQSEAEFAVNNGLSVNTLRKLESSTANPGFFVVDQVARVLDLDLNVLASTARGEASQ